MSKRSALAALVLAGFASGAFAQTQPSQPTQTPQPTQSSQSWSFGSQPSSALGIYGNSTQMTLLRQSMNDDARSHVTLEQLHRARQAVTLIKTNRCEDAYNMALTDEDFRLAGNVAVVCKAHFRQ